MYAFEIENVCKDYKSFQLKDVSFKLPKGCIMGLIGANGSGKSTTLNIMLNAISKKSGTIQFFEKDYLEYENEVKQDIGVLSDDSFFSDYLTPYQVGQILKDTYKKWDTAYYNQLLKRFQIPQKKKMKEFSRGMKMKTQLATALAHHPKLLILDEPTSGLDPIVREEILDIFLEFIESGENSVLLSTHILSDIEKIADYITLIDKGQIVLSREKDLLQEEYAVVKGQKEDLKKLDKEIVVHTKENQFGFEALVHRCNTTNLDGFLVEKASIEAIMLFFVRGGLENDSVD